MEERGTDKVIAFDTLFTTNQIQMLKVLLTYLPSSAQKNFAIYIKFMELQYTMSFFQNHPNVSLFGLPHEGSMNAGKLCDELLPLCDANQRKSMEQMKNMMQSFENMQQMMEMMQMMKELFPEGTGSADGSGADFLSGLAGMSGMPDLSGMDLSQIMGMMNMFHPDSE